MRKQMIEKRVSRKGRAGKTMMIMGLLLMAAALFLACQNFWEERQGELAAASVMRQMHDLLPADQEPDGLTITDAVGTEMDWPMDAAGVPMTWPTDEEGIPAESVTDGQGRMFFWPKQTDAVGESVPVSGTAWRKDADGALLPFARDGKGRVFSWKKNADGQMLDWDAMNQWWTGLIEDLLGQIGQLEAPAFVLHPEMEMPVSKIGGRYYVGMLEVPDRRLELPVMSDWNEEDLKISPCRYSGSVYSGDMVIAGHNYYRHFSPIKWLEKGTEVRFTDMDGNLFVYEVTGREVVGGYEVEEMLAGEWDLTLFTCTTGGKDRVAIRCGIREVVPAEE